METPKATPQPIVEKLNAEARKALADPTVRERIEASAGLPCDRPLADITAFVKAETAKSAEAVERAGVTVKWNRAAKSNQYAGALGEIRTPDPKFEACFKFFEIVRCCWESPYGSTRSKQTPGRLTDDAPRWRRRAGNSPTAPKADVIKHNKQRHIRT